MRKSRGISLVEVVTTASIITIMTSMLLPVMQQAREGVRNIACLNNQRQIAMAITLWSQDHNEDFPVAETMWEDIEMPAGSLRCPAQKDQVADNASRTRNDFAYSGFIAGKRLSAIKHPSEEIVVADAGQGVIRPDGEVSNVFLQREDIALRHGGSFIAGFCDGHAALCSELPPYWVIEIADAASFDRECLQPQLPVLAVFAQGGLAGPHTPPPYTNRALSLANYAAADLARQYRGEVKTVIIDSSLAPDLAASRQAGKDANGTYPGAAILLLAGKEVDRYIAHNPGCAEPEDVIQGMKDEVGAKVQAVVE